MVLGNSREFQALWAESHRSPAVTVPTAAARPLHLTGPTQAPHICECRPSTCFWPDRRSVHRPGRLSWQEMCSLFVTLISRPRLQDWASGEEGLKPSGQVVGKAWDTRGSAHAAVHPQHVSFFRGASALFGGLFRRSDQACPDYPAQSPSFRVTWL